MKFKKKFVCLYLFYVYGYHLRRTHGQAIFIFIRQSTVISRYLFLSNAFLSYEDLVLQTSVPSFHPSFLSFGLNPSRNRDGCISHM